MTNPENETLKPGDLVTGNGACSGTGYVGVYLGYTECGDIEIHAGALGPKHVLPESVQKIESWVQDG